MRTENIHITKQLLAAAKYMTIHNRYREHASRLDHQQIGDGNLDAHTYCTCIRNRSSSLSFGLVISSPCRLSCYDFSRGTISINPHVRSTHTKHRSDKDKRLNSTKKVIIMIIINRGKKKDKRMNKKKVKSRAGVPFSGWLG